MTTVIFGLIAIVAVTTVPVLVLIRLDERAEAKRRHPSNANWSLASAEADLDAYVLGTLAGFDAATEDAIEQAVAIVDDGKALVREAEDYLRRRAR